ncbi:hypothetical protein F5051DRAFT_503947 [Lentinula edodes]|nr:hypothetical protein F5051DRAFT_503947 [Lentinula edodes]
MHSHFSIRWFSTKRVVALRNAPISCQTLHSFLPAMVTRKSIGPLKSCAKVADLSGAAEHVDNLNLTISAEGPKAQLYWPLMVDEVNCSTMQYNADDVLNQYGSMINLSLWYLSLFLPLRIHPSSSRFTYFPYNDFMKNCLYDKQRQILPSDGFGRCMLTSTGAASGRLTCLVTSCGVNGTGTDSVHVRSGRRAESIAHILLELECIDTASALYRQTSTTEGGNCLKVGIRESSNSLNEPKCCDLSLTV